MEIWLQPGWSGDHIGYPGLRLLPLALVENKRQSEREKERERERETGCWASLVSFSPLQHAMVACPWLRERTDPGTLIVSEAVVVSFLSPRLASELCFAVCVECCTFTFGKPKKEMKKERKGHTSPIKVG